MSQVWAALDAAWRVLLVGIVLGAGLPALFALGVRAMAWGTGGNAKVHAEGLVPQANRAGKLIAYVLFALVLAIVVFAISYIVAHGLGYTLSLENGIPTFTPH